MNCVKKWTLTKITSTWLLNIKFKLNSVQDACTKCFAIHISKFEILQITLIKWRKEHDFCFCFSCGLQDFKFQCVNHKEFGASFLYWVDFKKTCYPWHFDITKFPLISGSCHLDRVLNVIYFLLLSCRQVLQFVAHSMYCKGALTQKRSFLVICTMCRCDHSVHWKNQNKHSTLNLSFGALSKWHEPDISEYLSIFSKLHTTWLLQ